MNEKSQHQEVHVSLHGSEEPVEATEGDTENAGKNEESNTINSDDSILHNNCNEDWRTENIAGKDDLSLDESPRVLAITIAM